MGGYAIIQQLSKDNSILIRSGPYCPGGGSNQPLITDDGPKYIFLSNWKTSLVIYAFGPEYWIDIDLIISTSLCEGFFDFPVICEAILEIPHNSFLIIQWGHFQLFCKNFSRSEYNFILVRLSKLSGCVIAQSIMYRQQISYEFELLNRIHINIKHQSPLFYGIGNETSYLGVIAVFWRVPNTVYRQSKLLTGNTDLQISDVTTLTYRQITLTTYHEIAMTMTIQTYNLGIGTIK